MNHPICSPDSEDAGTYPDMSIRRTVSSEIMRPYCKAPHAGFFDSFSLSQAQKPAKQVASTALALRALFAQILFFFIACPNAPQNPLRSTLVRTSLVSSRFFSSLPFFLSARPPKAGDKTVGPGFDRVHSAFLIRPGFRKRYSPPCRATLVLLFCAHGTTARHHGVLSSLTE